MYLLYNEYIELGGTEIEETAFNDLEFEARVQIDYYTFNRLKHEEELPEEVKRCMYKLIKLILGQQLALDSSIPPTEGISVTAGIVSQSNDGVSISYNTLSASEIVELSKDKIKSTINRYLCDVRNSLGQKVLYRGIYPNE